MSRERRGRSCSREREGRKYRLREGRRRREEVEGGVEGVMWRTDSACHHSTSKQWITKTNSKGPCLPLAPYPTHVLPNPLLPHHTPSSRPEG